FEWPAPFLECRNSFICIHSPALARVCSKLKSSLINIWPSNDSCRKAGGLWVVSRLDSVQSKWAPLRGPIPRPMSPHGLVGQVVGRSSFKVQAQLAGPGGRKGGDTGDYAGGLAYLEPDGLVEEY
ncbi:hypothetical protein JTE90_027911, partial [Oedothorax gibbosus]